MINDHFRKWHNSDFLRPLLFGRIWGQSRHQPATGEAIYEYTPGKPVDKKRVGARSICGHFAISV